VAASIESLARNSIMSSPLPSDSSKPHRFLKRLAFLVGGLLLLYLVVAYLVLPALWRRYAHRHPALDSAPGITQTANGIPGDPINVALVGTKAELVEVMQAAKWFEAAALGLRSDLKIAADTVLSRPVADAPVSSLYLFGRKEDLAFEQPVGDNPRHRHHVRFWQCDQVDDQRRPLWVGSAIYDEHVGLSRDTGQITHVTASDIDAERDYLFKQLKETGQLVDTQAIDGFHTILEGRNGGGDPWHTDGRLLWGVIQPDPKPTSQRPHP
jgi:hypothetical protein